MELVVNGESRDLKEGITLTELFAALRLESAYRAVAVNGQVIPRGDHSSTILKNGDRVEIIQAVGGGTGEDR